MMFRSLPVVAILLTLAAPAALAQDNNRNAKLGNEAAERTAVRDEYRQKMESKRRSTHHARQTRRAEEREAPVESSEESENKHREPRQDLTSESEESAADAPDRASDKNDAK